MFFRYLDPLLQPFRNARAKAVKAKAIKGNLKVETGRAKNYAKMAKGKVGAVKGQVGQVQGQAQQAQKQAGAMQGQVGQVQGQLPQAGAMAGPPGQMPSAPGAPGAPPGPLNPNPEIKIVGFFRKKKVCTQCNQQLDPTWDACPYCAQAAAAAAPAPAKTQAFMIDVAGSGNPMQLLGWIVPVQGPQRGELYTLAPVTTVGTDPTCTVVLADQYMSSHHAEIKAEGGVWVLRDLGSTNGTYVNDKRVDQHELVDNDFVKFGQSLVKFKSL